MRKAILSLLFVLTALSSYANINVENHPSEVFGFENRFNDDAVTFFEQGIRFHVFLNGDFDFDSRFYRTRRNRRVRVLRDWQGRISRVGNVRIRYDFRGNVRRIGRITMNYRRGWLRRVGNLTVSYNTYGDPFFYGNVGFDGFYNDYYYGNSWNVNIGSNFNWNVGAICVYNDPYFYGNEFRNSYRRVREDNNYIYYRANDGTNVSRDRILRRRKAASNTNGQTVRGRRDSNTNTATNARRRSVQNSSTNNDRRRSVQNSSTNTRRKSVQSTSTNNRRRTVQSNSTNNRRRAIQSESNNRRKPQVSTSQNRKNKVVRNSSSRKRSSQVNRTTKKKREIRNTTSSKRTKKEVKRKRS